MLALKDLMVRLRSANLDCRQDGARLDAGRRDFYLFNSTIAGIEEADALLIIGSNPRHEAPVLNARIRKRKLAGPFPIGAIGGKTDLTYAVEWLGDGPATIADSCRRRLPRPWRTPSEADDHRRAGQRWPGPMAPPCLAAAWKLAGSIGALTRGMARLQRAAPRGGRAGGRARSRLPAGPWRQDDWTP